MAFINRDGGFYTYSCQTTIQPPWPSGKKNSHTVKNIAITDLQGYCLFLSHTYEGAIHDKSRAFLYHRRGFVFEKGKYKVALAYSGKPDPFTGVLRKDGVEVSEEISFILEIG